MKVFSVDANIVALSGIAIAIGTMVDMGIVLTENIQKHLDAAPEGSNKLSVVHEASVEVGSAIIAAVSTTIISFIPIFTMEAAEGKLFKPLAWTKTFSLFAAIVVSLTIIPPLAHLFLKKTSTAHRILKKNYRLYLSLALILLPAIYLLAKSWQPFGPGSTMTANLLMTLLAVFGTIAAFRLIEHFYEPVLRWALAHKIKFLSLPMLIVVTGGLCWSGMHKEFMPPLDEGSFLYMPTTMPHASIGEALDQLATIDRLTSKIPEIENTVGKLGRTTSPLDPAPISMYENLINYKSEYITDEDGRLLKFHVNHLTGEFERDGLNQLIPDTNGKPFRQWREHIKSPRDIWNEITEQLNLPGVTGASELQPIAARLVMLQSGMRAPMGIKLKGSSQDVLENTARLLEQELKQSPGVAPATVIADKMLGKPYIEIDINREALGRYGLSVGAVQDVIEIVLGGKPLSTVYEGRERYSLRVRYPRELRGSLDDLKRIIVPAPHGQQIPLGELAEIRFSQQAEAIRSEDTALVTYITFDKQTGYSEIDVINLATEHLQQAIESGQLNIPAGVTWRFSGNYENQIRAENKLLTVLPLALFLIFFVLYLQFRSVSTSLLVFSGIIIAWSGGFIMLWLYGQDWFLNFSLFGINFRELFAVRAYNLSTAVWVGFIALFGIASDDGVLVATYITQQFAANKPTTVENVRLTILEAGKKRVRPALMTTATTIVALIPVLTSTGRGSDIMVPMAIPTFGGMVIALITIFVVPVLYCWKEEWKIVT
ncbi:MAG: efflux RND transporter permease subunit, partial [bacterium]|nr:efflux RND transporter permease subunit [bacterium]